jgi:putative endonuclease
MTELTKPAKQKSESFNPRSNNKKTGAAGEQLAEEFLRERGYRIIERNFRCRDGEIDLIVEKGRCLIFCEVKSKRSLKYGQPLEMITLRKRRQVARLARFYLRCDAGGARRFQNHRLRLDGIGILWLGSKVQIRHVPNLPLQ